MWKSLDRDKIARNTHTDAHGIPCQNVENAYQAKLKRLYCQQKNLWQRKTLQNDIRVDHPLDKAAALRDRVRCENSWTAFGVVISIDVAQKMMRIYPFCFSCCQSGWRQGDWPSVGSSGCEYSGFQPPVANKHFLRGVGKKNAWCPWMFLSMVKRSGVCGVCTLEASKEGKSCFGEMCKIPEIFFTR